MDNTQDLQAQIDELKRRMDALNASQTIPLAVDQSWQARGFWKQNSMVFGTGTLSGAGDYDLVIPGANANSIVMATPLIGGGASAIEAEIIESPTYPGQYQIHVEGTATSQFYYVVFLFGNNWYSRD